MSDVRYPRPQRGIVTQYFIHYLPRRVTRSFPGDASDPWFSEARAHESGFARPMYHTTRRRTGPSRTVEAGDSVWIVSQLFSPWGALPPAIDARVDVDRVVAKRDGSLRFNAAPTSAWFPLCDATSLLQTLETVDAKGNVSKMRANSKAPIGQELQSMRRLTDQDKLVAHTVEMSNRPLHFVSYRIIDGTFHAFWKTRELVERGEIVFWDRWCLPRRLAERREIVSNAALDRHLMEKLAQCDVVWGVESPRYAELKTYSAKERAAAIALGKYSPVRPSEAPDPSIERTSASRLRLVADATHVKR